MTRHLLLLSLALAGCDGASAPTTAAAPADTAFFNQVAALPEGQREGLLLRAIRDAGQNCQGVTATTRAGEPGGPPAWLATCTDKGQWLVVLKADGTAQVTNARDIARAAG